MKCKRFLIFSLLATFLTFIPLIPMVYAWQDDFQDGNYNGWTVYESHPDYTDVSIESGNIEFEPYKHKWTYEKEYSRYVYMYHNGYGSTILLYFTSPEIQTTYFSFRSINAYDDNTNGAIYIWYLDDEGNKLNKTLNLESYFFDKLSVLGEIVFMNNYAYLFVNGTLADQRYIGSEDVRYIRFECWYTAKWCIDDVSSEPYAMIDLGEYDWDWNATEYDDNEIDVYWTIPLYFDEEGDTYTCLLYTSPSPRDRG